MFKDDAKRKAKRILYLKVFLPFVFICTCLMVFFHGKNVDFLKFIGLFIAMAITLFIPFVIFRVFVIDGLSKKYEEEFINDYYKQQSLNEHYQYQRDLNRDMERRRRELEIEFEHLKKIILLNSSVEQSKMMLIHQIEKEFKQQKDDDLDSLNAQIERMKRELL